jgi:Glucose / Sorbosone dehydrogenase
MFISVRLSAALVLVASTALAQPLDPFPDPIPATDGVVKVAFTEFASLPDVDGEAARMMLMVDEPGTRRLFVNDMRGILYSVSYDGKTVAPFLDLRDAAWSLNVQAQNAERGFQSFAFHPDFNRRGARGFGKFYTYCDTANTSVPADFTPGGGKHTQDTVLLEWTAKNPAAASYDGGPPRELMRFEQPFANHNGGHLVFNPLASSRDDDFGLLYIGAADGGSGGDPLNLSQNPRSAFGKILRIDPLGSNSANGKYGIPATNPYAKGDKATGPLPEIFAMGVRNPQRFFWDSKTRGMFLADIGQNIVEEISPVTAGANLGWNAWEGSFAFNKGTIALENRRADSAVTYPIVEYAHADPLLLKNSAVTGGVVYRQNAIKQLKDLLIFGDNPSGEIFYIHADKLPAGGQEAIRRIMFDDKGQPKTLLQLIQAKNEQQGKKPASRVDLRFGHGPNGQVFVLNKRDGTIRLLVADGARNRG